MDVQKELELSFWKGCPDWNKDAALTTLFFLGPDDFFWILKSEEENG